MKRLFLTFVLVVQSSTVFAEQLQRLGNLDVHYFDGHMTNLLGQQQGLKFKEVREGTAIYYLATIKYTDREVLRFNIRLTPPEDSTKELKFQQQMYWDVR